ncbi:MAG: hypothetical protein MK135_14140 [Polyangiaceae bacterium]|nr:hypothetical protein [Polyangiaceae bacterium]
MEYAVSEIKVEGVSVQSEGWLSIRFRPILETLYYSPGVLVANDGRRLTLRVVRCPAQEKCQSDILSEYDDAGAQRISLKVTREVHQICLSDENVDCLSLWTRN